MLGPSLTHSLLALSLPSIRRESYQRKNMLITSAYLRPWHWNMLLCPLSLPLVPRTSTSSLALSFHSLLDHQLSDLSIFNNSNKTKINVKNRKILSFSISKKYAFLPQLNFPNCEPLEIIYDTQLLGVTISSNLSWQAHIDDISKRATLCIFKP